MTNEEIKTLENNAFVHADMARYCLESGDQLKAAMYLGQYFAETEMLGMDHEYETLSETLFEMMVEYSAKVFMRLFNTDYIAR